MSNCVLLDEYRHNLSAALGHLPEDEGDLEEEEEGDIEEEEEEEGGYGGEDEHHQEEEDKHGECLSNQGENYEGEEGSEEIDEINFQNERDFEEEKERSAKQLEDGSFEIRLGQKDI